MPTAFLFGLLFAPTAPALQQAPSPEELAAHATLVVTGEITTLEPRWATGAEGYIETGVWVAVEAVLKGDAPDPLALVIEGGRLGGFVTGAPDEPELHLDRRYLLFLVQDDRERWRVLGGPLGALLLPDGATVTLPEVTR